VVFSWIMAVILGAGASVVAWLSGEMLGVELLKYQEAAANAEKAYKGQETRWLNEARKHWYAARAEERKAAQPEISPKKDPGPPPGT
jgi:hypothetical protein